MVIIIIAAAHDDGYDGLDDADCDYIGGGQDGDDGEEINLKVCAFVCRPF